ncbi:MAG: NifU N-terminal domain-containing protein [Phycisphaeraceae bacterium]|nr:NifU N-terminal domain-containing protein [Phycisphaeraceae bacterium]
MPYAVTAFEPTPNPLALKCVLDRTVASPPKSFRTRPAAGVAGDPVAEALFAIEGVEGLYLCDDWITVRKAESAAWDRIRPAVRAALARVP